MQWFEDVKATAVGAWESIKEGDPMPVNVSKYYTGKTVSENIDAAKGFFMKYLIYLLVAVAILFFLYVFIKSKAQKLA